MNQLTNQSFVCVLYSGEGWYVWWRGHNRSKSSNGTQELNLSG